MSLVGKEGKADSTFSFLAKETEGSWDVSPRGSLRYKAESKAYGEERGRV